MPRMLQLLLAGLLLAANAGCLVVAAGAAAAGGAAAGYAYFSAPVFEDVPIAVPEAATATRIALADLQLPLVKEEQTAEGLKIESLTGEKKSIVILVSSRPQKLPRDGPITRISVRVGPFGDEIFSSTVLDQIHIRLPALPGGAPTVVQTTSPPQVNRGVMSDTARTGPGIVEVQTAEPPQALEPGPTSAVPQPIQPGR